MKFAYVGGRGSGKRALERQTAAQYARDQIAAGVDPKMLLTLAGPGALISTITYEEAAEMAFISDIIDKEVKTLIENEL